MEQLWYLVIAAAAYLIGSLNGSLLSSRLFWRDDIRRHGSGNAGATNVLRTHGVKWTAAVSAWDVGKGILAVWVGRWLVPAMRHSPEALEDTLRYAALLAGFFVIAGHVFPLFFKFKGGKGVITACAVFFTLDWQVASLALGLFMLILIFTRFLSLGSVCAVFTLPLLGLLFGRGWADIAMYAVTAALVIFLHRENIKRLLRGTENKFPRNKTAP
ncbi:MAG: glycerol-3-phosphate 1-O-acyltransferase PlsY [Oscillospiraceae bacterium]|jgi:glycerol-3-phosphate acyltransferase PlsY|nr:glycerol-3-phosphate 1-O-acyltransferase PlsY [Oscillospiraceae bacterium]